MSKTVLITGATSGIGYELSKVFARNGYSLVIIARDKNALEKTANELSSEFNAQVQIIAADLSQPHSPQEIFEKLQKQHITVDILVNNAGFGIYGDLVEIELDKQLNLIQLNIVALTALTHLFLPDMIKRQHGKILNTASTAAFQPGPHMAVYYATKSYVLSLSEALASELEGKGVTVTALCPGPTKTGFETGAAMGRIKLFKLFKQMSPAIVAQAGYDGLMKGKTIVIPGFTNAFLAFGNRLVPRSLATKLSKFTLE